MYFPSALQAMAVTSFEPASIELFMVPVLASHIFIVLSAEPVAILLPSGLNATAFTDLVCPLNVNKEPPETPSHIFALLSFDPVTK